MITVPSSTINAAAAIQAVDRINGTLTQIPIALSKGLAGNPQTRQPAITGEDFKAAIGADAVLKLKTIAAIAACTDSKKLEAALAAVS